MTNPDASRKDFEMWFDGLKDELQHQWICDYMWEGWQAARSDKGEAVYQRLTFDGRMAFYEDCNKKMYDAEANPDNKRILFTAPQQAIPAEPSDTEIMFNQMQFGADMVTKYSNACKEVKRLTDLASACRDSILRIFDNPKPLPKLPDYIRDELYCIKNITGEALSAAPTAPIDNPRNEFNFDNNKVRANVCENLPSNATQPMIIDATIKAIRALITDTQASVKG
jgi:hypothetical protein